MRETRLLRASEVHTLDLLVPGETPALHGRVQEVVDVHPRLLRFRLPNDVHLWMPKDAFVMVKVG